LGVEHWAKRHANVSSGTRFKTHRHDAHHGVTLVVQQDRSADDRRIAAKLVLPEIVANNSDAGPAGMSFLRGKTAANCERNSQDSEEVCRNPHPRDVLRLTSGCQVETGSEDVEGGHGLEDPAMLLPKK
jgi:hypothetical protein